MGLVNTDWLRKNLLSDNIKILDCSWHMPNSERSGKLEFEACHIPGSIFFDIDEFSDKKSSFPHTVLPDEKFSQMISDLGISNQDHIVVYDTLGIFSSPRVWWMFNYYGHNQISILDGGLIKWCKEKKERMDFPFRSASEVTSPRQNTMILEIPQTPRSLALYCSASVLSRTGR